MDSTRQLFVLKKRLLKGLEGGLFLQAIFIQRDGETFFSNFLRAKRALFYQLVYISQNLFWGCALIYKLWRSLCVCMHVCVFACTLINSSLFLEVQIVTLQQLSHKVTERHTFDIHVKVHLHMCIYQLLPPPL